jgi:hypothetical protein
MHVAEAEVVAELVTAVRRSLEASNDARDKAARATLADTVAVVAPHHSQVPNPPTHNTTTLLSFLSAPYIPVEHTMAHPYLCVVILLATCNYFQTPAPARPPAPQLFAVRRALQDRGLLQSLGSAAGGQDLVLDTADRSQVALTLTLNLTIPLLA